MLLEALEKGFLKNYQEFDDIFNKMLDIGFWIEKTKYNKFLKKAKELKE
ncbi:MAG: DUF3368 domain-containing protein [Promethearchaeota archaeon]|nr:MAG: DUF3368 domain-containing protein [Candidatus Lokiarchaeota archaeon]